MSYDDLRSNTFMISGIFCTKLSCNKLTLAWLDRKSIWFFHPRAHSQNISLLPL